MVDIEKIAVSAFTNLISRTERLQSFASEGDKEPHWDGSIHVYASAKKQEKDTIGRVPLQIKGTLRNRFHPRNPTYPVRISDLRQYLKEGGALYIVGVIFPNGSCQLYYCSLLPYDIKQFLQNISDHQTKKTIPLSLLPTDPQVLENLFVTFLQDRDFQREMDSSLEVLPFTELLKQGKIDPYSIHLSYKAFPGENMRPGLSIGFPCYMYAEDKNHRKIPINKVFDIVVEKESREIMEPISCEGIEYYSKYLISSEEHRFTIQIGKSCRYSSDKERNVSEFKLETAGTLEERLHAAKFFIAVIKNKGFYLGDHFVDLSENVGNLETELSSITAFAEKLDQTRRGMEKLGCVRDIDMDQFLEGDWDTISHFAKEILADVPVKLNVDDSPENNGKISRLSILTCGPMRLGVICNAAGNEKYYLKNLFNNNLEIELSGVRTHISPYLLLEPPNVLGCCNFNHDELLASIDRMEYSVVADDRAGRLLLFLLSEYDRTADPERLQESDKLSEWLYENNKNNPNHVYLLNRYQTLLRQRSLHEEEIEKLIEISESAESEETDKVGAYLLLGNQTSAKFHMKRLPEESRDQLLEWPISHFLDRE